MANEISLPKYTMIGKNALEESENRIKSFGKKAFIVTGKNITRVGTLKILTDLLRKWDVEYEVFNEIVGEPTDLMIEIGVQAYKDADCDFCIALGGGSPLDSGKAIIAMTKLEGSISDYMGKEIVGDFPPLVLIPTTAGTGSEATKFTIITDPKKNVKMLLKGNALLPTLAIIDSTFTETSPKGITIATGMDALTHAVEAYTSKRANSITDVFALSAIKRIFKYLPVLCKDLDNKTAREEMAIAAYEAGICINNSSVTLVHGMSRPIGALFHVPHGISNAMLINKALAYVIDGSYSRFGDIGRAVYEGNTKISDVEASEIFLEKLTELCEVCEIPTLKKYGINKDEFFAVMDKMAQDAITSGSPSNTIKSICKEDLLTIYKQLW